jgi:hypothetical protein
VTVCNLNVGNIKEQLELKTSGLLLTMIRINQFPQSRLRGIK